MTTWNPADKSANVTLSNGNLTVVASSSADGAVRSTTSKTAGKVYFEVTWASGSNGVDTSCGIATSSVGLGTVGPNGTGCALIYASGNIWINALSTGVSVGAFGNNTFSFAVDLTNSNLWIRNNNGNWNNSGTANPATNTGGLSISALFPTNAAFAVTSFNSTLPQATVNFGVTPFVFAVPSGFSGWDPLAPSTTAATAAAVAREALFATDPGLTAAGLVREVLTTTPTALIAAGLVREVLLLSPTVVLGGQTAITINTG